MKKLFIFISALFVVSSVSSQVLYKISGNGLTKPSYIMGTYHYADGSYVEKVKGLEKVFGEVEQFCGELSIEEIENLVVLQQKPGKELQKMGLDALPDGKTFKDIFTPEQFAVINAHAKKVFGTNFEEDPEALKSIGRMMPAQYSEEIQTVAIYKAINGKNVITSIDVYLLNMGKQLGKSVIGIETAEIQIDALYGKLSETIDTIKDLEKQKRGLFYVIEHWDKMMAINQNLFNAYMTQDIACINNILTNRHNWPYLFPSKSVYKKILTTRDATWARQMPTIMRDKSTFFFVGVYHLAGKPGVLNLLRKQGFTIEPVQ
jgi:uncharacterized protein YbaP (TraB family)